MAIYNTTNLTNTNDLVGFTQVINNFSEGMFGIMMYLSILVIIFGTIRMSNRNAETSKILAGTLWFGSILSLMFLRVELLAEVFVIAIFVLTMVFTTMLYLTRQKSPG